MRIFKKKDKTAPKKLFGNEIEPRCEYCSHNSGGETPVCTKGYPEDFSMEEKECPSFSYDPLMRTPRVLPPLREYDEEDFKL